MPGYDSPIGSKRIPAQPLREFSVPDESMEQELAAFTQRVPQDFSSVEKEIKEAREAKRSGKERLSEGAKRRIEILVGMTRFTRSVEIEGNQYVFQTLRSKEMREAISSASQFDGTVQSPYEIRRQFLARSLIQVAGASIEQFLGSDDLESRLSFIDELPEQFVSRLHTEYSLMVQEAKDKYSIKNAEEAKEVMEELKK